MGAFEDRADGDAVLLPAILAAAQTGAYRLPRHAERVRGRTVGADRTIGPAQPFEKGARFVFVRLLNVHRAHVVITVLSNTLALGGLFVKYISPQFVTLEICLLSSTRKT